MKIIAIGWRGRALSRMILAGLGILLRSTMSARDARRRRMLIRA
jgi:hypothetical protein